MHDDHSHPILQQTSLSVNPFIDLPKPPTLPPNYTSLPSTLPPSTLQSAPSPSNPEQPAYVFTSAGGFAAHPSVIIAQNRSLLEQMQREKDDGGRKVKEWEESIQERELQERRRKAPGWLDREERILEPEKAGGGMKEMANVNLMDELEVKDEAQSKTKEVDDLGEAMDRAFGRVE